MTEYYTKLKKNPTQTATCNNTNEISQIISHTKRCILIIPYEEDKTDKTNQRCLKSVLRERKANDWEEA